MATNDEYVNPSTPPEIAEKSDDLIQKTRPKKSIDFYDKAYDKFAKICYDKKKQRHFLREQAWRISRIFLRNTKR